MGAGGNILPNVDYATSCGSIEFVGVCMRALGENQVQPETQSALVDGERIMSAGQINLQHTAAIVSRPTPFSDIELCLCLPKAMHPCVVIDCGRTRERLRPTETER